ncbi:MAG: penicillin-binding protein [Clostridia bacterium]|nr:penicillin-binding protein [Clostridia bacterium]
MPFKKKSQFQLTVLSVILIIAVLLYTARVYSLQIANADKYTDNTGGAASVRTAVLKAPRGEILDCYGRQIAINRDGYNIVFNKAYVGDNLNDVILALVNLLDEYATEWIDKLPITKTQPYSFIEGENTDKLIGTLELAHYATAENCIVRMIEKYELEDYTADEQRKIMAVRYGMDISDFSISYPYTFAEDIPTELMRKISESGFMLSGVSVDVVPFREYTDTSLAVNLIGSVGPIYEEDWDNPEKGENYKARGYSYNDKVGKSGIEYWAEEYLRGTDGEISYRIDANGNIISSEVTKEPQAGKTVMLTLDKVIQRKAQDSLAQTVQSLQAGGGTAVAGAAVAIEVNSGSVICAANYPTYDSATLGENYEAIKNNPAKPLTNRAFKGIYPIGSTIKPIVAIAAIDNSKYNLEETIRCVHTYTYFSDYTPSCMGTHGFINLKTALSKSCNYFFFELGRRVGAMTLTDYFKQFGLGTSTGVEVDDSAGLIIQPESDGMGGDTLQFSIGQLNAFTPLQLANYSATLANGGAHYDVTLIDKVVSYDFSTVYEDKEPEIVNQVQMSEKALAAVKEGMLSVTVDGTGQATLGDYPIKVGGKTGTSQVTNAADHSVFIAFAPFDNPEIAISVVLEHGSSGYSAGSIVRSILDAYFFSDYNTSEDTKPFVVLD